MMMTDSFVRSVVRTLFLLHSYSLCLAFFLNSYIRRLPAHMYYGRERSAEILSSTLIHFYTCLAGISVHFFSLFVVVLCCWMNRSDDDKKNWRVNDVRKTWWQLCSYNWHGTDKMENNRFYMQIHSLPFSPFHFPLKAHTSEWRDYYYGRLDSFHIKIITLPSNFLQQ